MTIKEALNFYNNDEKKYDLNNNEEFAMWLNKVKSLGYVTYMTNDFLQDLIDKLVTWYEIKYPDKQLEQGVIYPDFKNIKPLSEQMDFKQLLYRLNERDYAFLECGYRASCYGSIGSERIIFVTIKRLDKQNQEYFDMKSIKDYPYFNIYANFLTGKVKTNEHLEALSSNTDFTLESLLEFFEKNYQDSLDYTSLKRSVENHKADLILRKMILEYATLKLLYSRNTAPEIGYKRAKNFILEMNENIPNLDLNFDVINKIMEKDYSKDEDVARNLKRK